MALIKCPHCGNEVSDTGTTCIHCGKSIVPVKEEREEEKLVEYTRLKLSERNELRDEFQKVYPKHKNFEQREETLKKIKKASTISTFVGGAIGLFFVFIIGSSNPMLGMQGGIVGLVLFFISDVMDILCPILLYFNKKKSIVALKLYQRWLKDHKKINYVVTFNEADRKWKKYFDNINVMVEGYKG